MNTEVVNTLQDIRSALIHVIVTQFKGTPIPIEHVPSSHRIAIRIPVEV